MCFVCVLVISYFRFIDRFVFGLVLFWQCCCQVPVGVLCCFAVGSLYVSVVMHAIFVVLAVSKFHL